MTLMVTSQSYLALNFFNLKLYKIIVRLFQNPTLRLSTQKIKALYHPYAYVVRVRQSVLYILYQQMVSSKVLCSALVYGATDTAMKRHAAEE